VKTPFIVTLALTLVATASAKSLTVGFAQTGSESNWRVANSESIKAEAAKRGVDLKFVDCQSQVDKQRDAVKSFIADKVDAIVLAPLVVDGWDPMLRDAKAAGIPVIVMDRKIVTSDSSMYATFIGSDFYKEGEMAGQWVAAKAGERRKIVELLGEPGSSAANERHRAFAATMGKHADAGFRIVDRRVGNFRRDKGEEGMAELLKAHPGDIEILFAHNDDMALGAIAAIKAAGLKPGKDILVVTIDATKPAMEAVAAGEIGCTVECNPLFGPKVFDAVERLVHGEAVIKESYNKDELYDATNAAAALPTRKY